MDWSRKHLCELSVACKDCENDLALAPAHREAFIVANALVKQSATLPCGGGYSLITKAITLVCGACRLAAMHNCGGRTDWSEPCKFMQEHLRKPRE